MTIDRSIKVFSVENENIASVVRLYYILSYPLLFENYYVTVIEHENSGNVVRLYSILSYALLFENYYLTTI